MKNINILPGLEIPPSDRKEISLIREAIECSSSALVSFHARPDGDAIGGSLALKNVLEKKGLDVTIISPSPPSEVFSFLEGFESIRLSLEKKKFDLCFILDCSDNRRLESLTDILQNSFKIINIDHHQLNRMKADINYVRPDSSSVCELIFNIALELDSGIDLPAARSIYTGILTDTNRFQEKNATPRSHRIAAEFIERGIDPVEIFSKIYGNLSLNRLKLVSRCIESLKVSTSGRVAYIVVTPDMLVSTGTTDETLEGIINYARNLKGVEVGILFRKVSGLNGIKVSFRSKGKVDVGRLAGHFGGGGHHNAGGCLVKGRFEEAVEKVLGEIEKWME